MAASSRRRCSPSGSFVRVIVHYLVVSSCVLIVGGAPSASDSNPAPVDDVLEISQEQCIAEALSFHASLAPKVSGDVDEFVDAIESGKNVSELQYPAEGCKQLLDAAEDKSDSDPKEKLCAELYQTIPVDRERIDASISARPESMRVIEAMNKCTIHGPVDISPRWCVRKFIVAQVPLFWEIPDDVKAFTGAILAGKRVSELEYPAASCILLRMKSFRVIEELNPRIPEMEKCDELYRSEQAMGEEFDRLMSRNVALAKLKAAFDACRKGQLHVLESQQHIYNQGDD